MDDGIGLSRHHTSDPIDNYTGVAGSPEISTILVRLQYESVKDSVYYLDSCNAHKL